ncbi:MAG: two-component system NtrC family sensor kinase, partial [Candidatus Omnitrophota bacterium]
DLRAFSRQESEEKNTFKVDDVLENVLRIVHNELKYKVNITTDFKDTPEIKGYAQKIGQVFINLLINAAQAIEKNGTISIKTWCDAKYVYISVADTGEGIEEEILSNIFNPFFTTKPVGTGTGLGLSISYEIITEHGGEIKCYSQAGEGATFLVSLPFE